MNAIIYHSKIPTIYFFFKNFTYHTACPKEFWSLGIHRTQDICDDVYKWKYFPCYWPFVRGFHETPVNSPHKGLQRGALLFYLICAWRNGWVNETSVIWDVIASIVTSLWCYPALDYDAVSNPRLGNCPGLNMTQCLSSYMNLLHVWTH